MAVTSPYPCLSIFKDSIILNSGISFSQQSNTRSLIAITVPNCVGFDSCMAVWAISYARSMNIMNEIIFNTRAGNSCTETLETNPPAMAATLIISDDIILNGW